MRLSEIKKVLEQSRPNGIYFHDAAWGKHYGDAGRGLAYLSKTGHLFMTYLHPIKNQRLVIPFSPDMENMLRPSESLVIWEGSV